MSESAWGPIKFDRQELIQQRAYDLLNQHAESMPAIERCLFAAAVVAWGVHCTDELGRALVRGILDAFDGNLSD